NLSPTRAPPPSARLVLHRRVSARRRSHPPSILSRYDECNTMPRPSATAFSFPPFTGTTRRLVLANVAVFFAIAILQLLAPIFLSTLLGFLELHPAAAAHGQLWQLVTYSFLHFGILDILFAMMTLFFCGSLLEGAYGSRWLRDLYFASAIGGALLASILSFTHILGLDPRDTASGAWAAIFGLLIAIAMRFGDQEFLVLFLFTMRAKYMVAISILIAFAMLLKSAGALAALLQLSGALCGYLYVQYAPRRGFAFGFSEQYFGMRNAYYRAKRRRAARKFEVYMGKQGRKVHFDAEGRYIDPDAKPKDPSKDSNDKRWMN
ncbi:MAG TPA: rhomboid family intramembrane serine protease, partial [Acidobacteriaceae bacterium]|nr:rhomboid family intramembrane serine protease [Acidobacteriaceae bacterium]